MDTNQSSSRCAFWISTQIDEAVQSARSFRDHMPDVDRWLLTPEHGITEPIFDGISVLPPAETDYWFLDSTRWMKMAPDLLPQYEQLLYMDSDTYTIHPFMEIFDLLTRFDFAGAHAPGRRTCPTLLDVPASFPEINIGVNVFQNNEAVRELMDTWLVRYQNYAKKYGNNDQGPLRDALWLHALIGFRLYVLPPEYNCRFGFGGFARGHVRVLHGRARDIDAVGRAINADTDLRGWRRGEYE